MSAPQQPAEQPVSPITEDDLKGLPPRAMVALAVRAAWRSLPAGPSSSLPNEVLRDVAAGIAVATLGFSGYENFDRDMAANLAAKMHRVHLVGNVGVAVANAVYAVLDLGYAEAEAVSLVDFVHKALEASFNAFTGIDARDAALSEIEVDLNWLSDLVVGRSGLEEFERPLWSRDTAHPLPSIWGDYVGNWRRAVSDAGLSWLVSQYDVLARDGGVDLRPLTEFLDEYRQDAATEGNDADTASVAKATKTAKSKTKPKKKPPPDSRVEQEVADTEAETATEQQTEPPPELLPTGIVTASADSPALIDHLGRKYLVTTLADMLSSPEQDLPMTIALLGDWGSGKSSVLEQLKLQLRRLVGEQVSDKAEDLEQSAQPQPEKSSWRGQIADCWRGLRRRPGESDTPGDPNHCRYLYAEFNAWEYEQTDNVRAGLAQEVVRGLTGDLSKCEKLRLAVANAALQHGIDFYLTITGLLLIGVLGVLGVLSGPLLKDMGEFNQSLLGTGGAAILVFGLVKSWQKLMRFLKHPLADKLSTYLRLPDYGSHLGEIPVIKREIEGLCAARLDVIPNGRLLVIVDDLDRCHPDKVIETLDAIRLVMNLKRVAVIIAIDDRIAFRAVADHYKALAEDGKRSKEEIARDYLGKIIQLPVNLYQPWPWEVEDFITNRLFKVESPSFEQTTETANVKQADKTDGEAQEVVPAEQPELSSSAAALIAEQGLQGVVFEGSGQGGRVLKKDVEAYLATRQAATAKPPEAPRGAEVETNSERDSSVVEEGEDQLPKEETAEEQERREQMKDTRTEMNLFAELSWEMNFHNPRQLIRLRNSYRLLKGYRQSREEGRVDAKWVKYLMHGLFWYEFLYQQKLADRQAAEVVAWEWPGDKWVDGETKQNWEEHAALRDKKTAEKCEALKKAGDKRAKQLANPPVVNMSRRLCVLLPGDDWTDGYPGLMKTVEMVVLPNAQMGLMLKRGEVDELLKRQSTTGKSVEIDPWNLKPLWDDKADKPQLVAARFLDALNGLK